MEEWNELGATHEEKATSILNILLKYENLTPRQVHLKMVQEQEKEEIVFSRRAEDHEALTLSHVIVFPRFLNPTTSHLVSLPSQPGLHLLLTVRQTSFSRNKKNLAGSSFRFALSRVIQATLSFFSARTRGLHIDRQRVLL